jgi:chromosome segregation ATPase
VSVWRKSLALLLPVFFLLVSASPLDTSSSEETWYRVSKTQVESLARIFAELRTWNERSESERLNLLEKAQKLLEEQKTLNEQLRTQSEEVKKLNEENANLSSQVADLLNQLRILSTDSQNLQAETAKLEASLKKADESYQAYSEAVTAELSRLGAELAARELERNIAIAGDIALALLSAVFITLYLVK